MGSTFTRRQVSAGSLAVAIGGLTAAAVPPRPRVIAAAQANSAIEAAVTLSEYEVDQNLATLYRSMHPDSVVLVPYYAVDYWYRTTFFPRQPEVIEPTGVRTIDWTWDVNGVTYPDTAEVAFTQTFGDGETVEDVVRLVRFDNRWTWFFGRSRDFIDEQIELGSADVYPAEPSDPPAWAAAAVARGIEALDDLPEEYPGEEEATIREGAGDGGFQRRVYVSDEAYAVGSVQFNTTDGVTGGALGYLNAILAGSDSTLAFEVLSWDLSDGAEIPHVTFRTFGDDAVGNVVDTLVASEETGSIWTVSARELDVIDVLGAALGG